MPGKVKTGLDIIKRRWPGHLRNTRTGLLVHPASINRHFKHALDICSKSGKFKLKALFGPQHGIRGETQDNMVEWKGFRDIETGLPVYSLYGETRQPQPHMLKDIDTLIIDMQDVGARYYTFIWTMALAMESCHNLKKAVVVLDRPNPIGGHLIEGPVLTPEYKSFVGIHKLPIRHGMTVGEIAFYLKDIYYPMLDLHVIPMEGWKRRMWFDNTGLRWVLPSPNIPTLDSATVYAGMCLLEGTNLSEGRGTTRPFEIFGAPFIVPDLLIQRLNDFKLPGVIFRPICFIPTFHKYEGKLCKGAQLHVINREKYKPFLTSVSIIKAVHDVYPKYFAWKKPPYEYEKVLLPIDILTGTDRVRRDIEDGVDLKTMGSWWHDELTDFDKKFRRKYLFYT